MSVPFKKEQYIIIYEPQGKYMHIHMKKIIYGFSKKKRYLAKKPKKHKLKDIVVGKFYVKSVTKS